MLERRPRPVRPNPIRGVGDRHARTAWIILGVLLALAGFALDPYTVVGHHALLIGGGMIVGWNLHA